MVDIDKCVVGDYSLDVVLELNKFESGNEYLDIFLYDDEKSDSSKYGHTRLVIETETKDIIGFYTICASAISLNKDFKKNESIYYELKERDEDSLIKYVGAIGISCFAINKKYRGQYTKDSESQSEYKVSHFVLDEAFKDIEDASNILGTNYVILSSTAEGRTLYYDYGFEFLDYNDKQQYLLHKKRDVPEVTQAEKDRKDKFIFNINYEEIGCYPMMLNLS